MKTILILLLFTAFIFPQRKNEIKKARIEVVLNDTSNFAIFRKNGNDYIYDLYKYKIVGRDTSLILLASDRTVKLNDLTQTERDSLDNKK